ncbi:MAG: hypothetical protein HZA91_08055 [Verrucomicrobia bacterium]|nr:hypothetical protein [Verrucomicrobiota bacterium]
MNMNPKNSNTQSSSTGARNRWRGLVAAGFAAVLCGVVSAFVSCGGGSSDATPPASPPASPYEALVGRWVRPDGGYVLAINRVQPDGTVEAGYFNPNPIRVARARASSDGGKLELFVELRDAGYPGCTYKLTYDQAAKKLTGVYFQAAQQESYNIFFAREE